MKNYKLSKKQWEYLLPKRKWSPFMYVLFSFDREKDLATFEYYPTILTVILTIILFIPNIFWEGFKNTPEVVCNLKQIFTKKKVMCGDSIYKVFTGDLETESKRKLKMFLEIECMDKDNFYSMVKEANKNL